MEACTIGIVFPDATKGQFKMLEKKLKINNLQLSYYDSETSGPVLVFAHANGYSALCCKTYFAEWKKKYRILALDFSGHGNSDSTVEFSTWFFFRDQILALLEKELPPGEKAVGIGHSLGGASILLSSEKRADLFEKVIALDPVVLGWRLTTLAKILGNPLAKQAQGRRRRFQSIELVERAFRKFPAFANWEKEIWEDYKSSCLRKTGDGKEVELSCDPLVEAKIFSLSSYRVFMRFYRIQGETHICIPEKYEVCSPRLAKLITRKNPLSSVEIWKDATHFFPFEWRDRTLQYTNKILGI